MESHHQAIAARRDEGDVATCDGVRMGINDVEILNARNYFIVSKDGARTTARQAPSPTGGGGAEMRENGGIECTSPASWHFTNIM
jgi:hypothetical protein